MAAPQKAKRHTELSGAALRNLDPAGKLIDKRTDTPDLPKTQDFARSLARSELGRHYYVTARDIRDTSELLAPGRKHRRAA